MNLLHAYFLSLCQILCKSVEKWRNYGRLTIFKMAVAAILNRNFATLDHPRSLFHGPKSVLKFHVNRFTTFRDMAIGKFCKFVLKCLFPPPKLTFLGGFDPKRYSSSSRPPKGTSLGEYASFELSRVKIGQGV